MVRSETLPREGRGRAEGGQRKGGTALNSLRASRGNPQEFAPLALALPFMSGGVAVRAQINEVLDGV